MLTTTQSSLLTTITIALPKNHHGRPVSVSLGTVFDPDTFVTWLSITPGRSVTGRIKGDLVCFEIESKKYWVRLERLMNLANLGVVITRSDDEED